MSRWFLVLGLFLPGGACLAQSSANHRIESGTLNAGGRPQAGATAQSASHRLSLDAIGGIVRAEAASGSWRVGSSLPLRYRPPGETLGLRFVDDDSLTWQPERSVGRYNLYRNLISTLGAGSFGLCLQRALATPSADDPAIPPNGAGFFYLVTAENLLGEEGTLGAGSDGPRNNANSCP